MPQQLTVLDAPIALDQRPDQRQAERHQVRRSATVRVLDGGSLVLHGRILNISEGGSQIRLEQSLPCNTLVRIEYDDNLFLGEVIYCQQEQAGWLVGVRVEHALFGLTALADRMEDLESEPLPGTSARNRELRRRGI